MINIRYLASMPDDAINPYADEPLYVQLAGIVRRMIQSGKLQHLDPVPSESSLVQAYGVSRDTVRRTIALLRDEGVVFTVPHRGTYVGPRPQVAAARAETRPAGGRGWPPGLAGLAGLPPAPGLHSVVRIH